MPKTTKQVVLKVWEKTRTALTIRSLFIVTGLSLSGSLLAFWKFFRSLPMPGRITLGICLALVLFPLISYAWAAICQWWNKPEGGVPMKSDGSPEQTEIKDINLKLDVKDTDEAIGINVENTPTKLSNVQLQIAAQRAGSVIGMKITSNNAPALSSITIVCSCGYRFNSTTACGYKEELKCPKCGRVYED